MIGATTLALFFVPLFYVLVSQLSEKFFPPKAAAAVEPPPPPPVAEAPASNAGGH